MREGDGERRMPVAAAVFVVVFVADFVDVVGAAVSAVVLTASAVAAAAAEIEIEIEIDSDWTLVVVLRVSCYRPNLAAISSSSSLSGRLSLSVSSRRRGRRRRLSRVF